MEERKKYRVFYDDGDKVRDKLLVFKCFSNNFAIFLNPLTNKEEQINADRIIRIEEVFQ